MIHAMTGLSGMSGMVIQVAGGGAHQNEIQLIIFGEEPVGGEFTIEFDGEETTAIPAGTDAATIQGLMEALPNIGAGNMEVVYLLSTQLTFEFIGDLGNLHIAPIVSVPSNTLTGDATDVDVTVQVEGTDPYAGLVEVQSIEIDPAVIAGSWNFDGNIVDWNINTASLDTLFTAGTILGNSPSWQLNWTAVGPQPLISVSNDSLRIVGTVSIETTVAGDEDTQEVRVITVDAVSGNWQFRGNTLTSEAPATDLTVHFPEGTVIGADGGPYTLTFNDFGDQSGVATVVNAIDLLKPGGSVVAAQITNGEDSTPGTQEVQVITLAGDPDGGTWIPNIVTALSVAWNAEPPAVEATFAGEVTVTGAGGGLTQPFTLTWNNPGVRDLVVSDGTNLTRSIAMIPLVIQEGF